MQAEHLDDSTALYDAFLEAHKRHSMKHIAQEAGLKPGTLRGYKFKQEMRRDNKEMLRRWLVVNGYLEPDGAPMTAREEEALYGADATLEAVKAVLTAAAKLVQHNLDQIESLLNTLKGNNP